MEWLDRLNKSIYYLEDNLAGQIDFEQAAKIACCSSFHFQRMFSYIANVSLAEYIRRRRMTLASFELQNSEIKVIDLALKYCIMKRNSLKNLMSGSSLIKLTMFIMLLIINGDRG